MRREKYGICIGAGNVAKTVNRTQAQMPGVMLKVDEAVQVRQPYGELSPEALVHS
jgi:hypothetical protein